MNGGRVKARVQRHNMDIKHLEATAHSPDTAQHNWLKKYTQQPQQSKELTATRTPGWTQIGPMLDGNCCVLFGVFYAGRQAVAQCR
jgi:hypothetical protein